jgi:hypothetical protein
MLLNQGPGYSDFSKYPGPKFAEGLRRLISQIRNVEIPAKLEPPLENIMNVLSSVNYPHNHSIPIWLHKRAKPLNIE